MITLLLTVSPMAGALTPHVLVAPYKGTAWTASRSESVSGNCRTSFALKAQHWLPKTGNETGYADAAGNGCMIVPTGPGSSYAYIEGFVGVAFPVKVPSNGAHNFSVAWSYSYTPTARIVGPINCPVAKSVAGFYTSNSCGLSAAAGASMYVVLYDLTNHTTLIGDEYLAQPPETFTDVYNTSYCTASGSCSSFNGTDHCGAVKIGYQNCIASGSRANGTNTTWIDTGSNCRFQLGAHCYTWQNWTLNRSHVYSLLAQAYFIAYISVSGYGSGHGAVASVNGATQGNSGWRITSVTVT